MPRSARSATRRRRRRPHRLLRTLTLSARPQKGNFEDAKCMTEIKALNECMALQAKKPKEMNTVNFHLQRLSNAAKR